MLSPLRWVTVRRPEISENGFADPGDVGDEVLVRRLPCLGEATEVVLEQLHERGAVRVCHPHRRPFWGGLRSWPDRQQEPAGLLRPFPVGGHSVQRLEFQGIRRALAFEDNDCSLRCELIVGELEVPTFAIEFTERIG